MPSACASEHCRRGQPPHALEDSRQFVVKCPAMQEAHPPTFRRYDSTISRFCMITGVSWYGSFFVAPIRLPGPFFWPPAFLALPPCIYVAKSYTSHKLRVHLIKSL